MKNNALFKKFIGDKAFYLGALAIIGPILLQNAITTFVGLLDNLMVGTIGTEQMSGVAVVNQLIFLYNVTIFGGLSGAGIFAAQFHGKGDEKGLRYCLRFKVMVCALLTALFMAAFIIFKDALIDLFIHEGGETGDIELTHGYAVQYLSIILFSLIPSAITQIYACSLREVGETVFPMKAGLIAVVINCIFNYLLIFGVWFFPQMGVEGAAIATLIARVAECLIIVIRTHLHIENFAFFKGAYTSPYIPAKLGKEFIVKGMPLMLNEFIWASVQTLLFCCYSLRGLSTVAAMNISNTLNNLFTIVFLSIGTSIAIIVGNLIGEGKLEEAVDSDNKLIALAVCSCVLLAIIMIAISPLITSIYKTSDEVRQLAIHFIAIVGAFMPLHALLNCTYYTLRSGGKTFMTFLFDAVFTSFVNLPIAYVLAAFTALPIQLVYIAVMASDIIKCVWGIILLKKRIWLNDLTTSNSET